MNKIYAYPNTSDLDAIIAPDWGVQNH